MLFRSQNIQWKTNISTKLVEGYRSDFVGYSVFSPQPLLCFFSQREKRKQKTKIRKQKVNNVGLKELDQLMQEKARPTNVCEEKNYQ